MVYWFDHKSSILLKAHSLDITVNHQDILTMKRNLDYGTE